VSYSVHVVCAPAVASGFGLAGLHTTGVATAEQAEQRVRDLLSDAEMGVILMEQPLYGALSPELRRELARRPLPIVVPFPTAQWGPRPEGPDAYIIELLRQAIGYRVRLR
jgi:vacuolar-type H+-ATPase subunit F/Vma7